MKKRFLILISIGFFILAMTLVSAARLPTVDGDDSNWGTVLNECLNVSLNESGHLRANNLSIGSQITLAFGEIIDNIINGWVRITGNLNVSGNATISGSSLTVGGQEVCLVDGTNCQESSGSISANLTFNPILGYTASSYTGDISNGSLIGYAAANAICAAEYASSHFCLKSEILKTIANGNYTFTGTAWFQNGPPGYTANSDDCSGWTDGTSSFTISPTSSNLRTSSINDWKSNNKCCCGWMFATK